MRDVANLVLNRLNYSRSLYEAKLRQLNVYFEPAEITGGCLEIDYNKNLSRITIKINTIDSINYIRFIMAHEMYHLLFSSNSPVAAMGYNFTDQSYQVNSIIRRNSDGEYGTQLNEQIANILAFETISKNMVPEEDGADMTMWNQFAEFYRTFLTPVKSLVDSFNTREQRDWNLESGIEVHGRFIPDNIFLYGCVNGRSESYVNEYEKVMGNHSWQRLNKLIDLFYAGNEAKGVEPFERVVFNTIQEELTRFQMFKNLKEGA